LGKRSWGKVLNKKGNAEEKGKRRRKRETQKKKGNAEEKGKRRRKRETQKKKGNALTALCA
jgi:hypothetical protein